MAETNAELSRAVREALSWLGATPETAGAVLGMNGRTLDAMCQGIVPMRSLVIRFATGLSRHCERQGGAPEWWADVDAWLKVAGYPPRRDGDPAEPALPRAPGRSAPGDGAPPASTNGARPSAVTPPPPASDEPPAREIYHPVYERKAWGDTVVHVFWILDREDRQVFQINVPAHLDYKARAAEVKRDLASLPRIPFERKYGRFRV